MPRLRSYLPNLVFKSFVLLGTALNVATVLFAMSFLLGSAAYSKVPNQRIKLEDQVTKNLGALLKDSEELYKALISQSDVGVKDRLKTMNQHADEALKRSKDTRDVKSNILRGTASVDHLDWMLIEMKRFIKGAMESSGNERKSFLQETFRQLVLLVKSYQIDHPYQVYFCRKDRSVWLQRGTKPKNPINPETYSTCGVKVR